MLHGCLAFPVYLIPLRLCVCTEFCNCNLRLRNTYVSIRILLKILLCLGDFSVSDFQLAYINLDDENEGKLSKAMRVLRAKRRWALDEFQLQTDDVLTITRVCVCACFQMMLSVLLK